MIAIIGVLVGCSCRRCNRRARRSRRIKCLNNLKQLALAMHNFHDTFGRMPQRRLVHWCNGYPAAKPSYIPAAEWGQTAASSNTRSPGAKSQFVQQRPRHRYDATGTPGPLPPRRACVALSASAVPGTRRASQVRAGETRNLGIPTFVCVSRRNPSVVFRGSPGNNGNGGRPLIMPRPISARRSQHRCHLVFGRDRPL